MRSILCEVRGCPVMQPGVLMVTGAYYPEVSGAGVQCRTLVNALKDQVDFSVLTTTLDRRLPLEDVVDSVAVYRIPVDPTSPFSLVRAALRLVRLFVTLRSRFQIVHLHGFSRKTRLVILLARCFRKRIIQKLTSAGHDDPLSIRTSGRAAFWWYSRADLYFGVSARLQELYHSSGLPREKFWLVPNGVDVERFRLGDRGERRALRRALGLPEELTLILFVGFFSLEKCPDLLFKAWTRTLVEDLPATGLVFVGATRSRYFEVDLGLAQRIRVEAHDLGVEKRVIFVEVTHEIEKYYRAADVFVLPSSREGLPNSLLEAMATGLPCVVSRLPGVTDGVIDHGVNGLLFPPGDVAALEGALRLLLQDLTRAQELGRKARETVEGRYSITQTAARCLEAYQRLAVQSLSRR